MKTALKMWLGDKRAAMMMLVSMVLSTIGSILNAQVIFMITNAFNDIASIWVHAANILIICILAATTQISGRYLRTISSAVCFNGVDKELSAKITKVKYQTYVTLSCDKIITMASHLPDIVCIVPSCADVLMNVVYMIITLIYIAIVGKKIVIPIIILYSTVFVAFYLLNKKFIKFRNQKREAVHKRDEERNEIINGFAEVRSFAMELTHCNSLWESTQKVLDLMRSTQLIISGLILILEIADTIAIYLSLGYAVKGLTEGWLTAASSLLLVNYTWRLSQPIDVITDRLTDIHEQLTFVKDYENFMNTIDTKDGSIEMTEFNSDITIKDLSFKYDKSETILNDINLSIKKGEHIGICGTSGGGKSTLLKVLARFYDKYNGSISIDGVDIREFTNTSFRRFIGMVQQDNFTFNDTIYKNITYGSVGFTESGVIEACKKASLYEFIMSLPDKFDTVVGPRGLKLSGGQKQRIALARIFLRNPEIVIFDEATSALDNISESIIQEAIEKLENKTLITVAHRLSTIRNCDKIIVIGNHKVAEVGTHDELIAKNGIYASLQK